MSQISPPIRIVLVGAVLFLAAWMTVLKPKSDEPTAAAPTTTSQGNLAKGKDAVSSPGKIVQKARDAANAESAHEQAVATGDDSLEAPATGSSTQTTSQAAQAAGKAAAASGSLAGVPAPVVKAITKQKVIVLAFLGDTALDRSVRRSLAKADRWDGRVFVKSVPLRRVGRYSRVTSGAQVDQSPSVVVVDRALRATTIKGYTTTTSIDQAVVDALRASGGLFTSPYLRKVNAACTQYGSGFFSIAQPSKPSQVQPYVERHAANLAAFTSDVRGIKAPARYAALQRGIVADTVALHGIMKSWSAAMGKRPSVARILSSTSTAVTKAAPIDKRLSHRLEKNHLISCS